MKTCTTEFKFCKCSLPTKLKIRQPSLFSPVIFNFVCSGCNSKYLVRCKGKPSLPNVINIQASLQEMSPVLKQIIEEDQQQDAETAS